MASGGPSRIPVDPFQAIVRWKPLPVTDDGSDVPDTAGGTAGHAACKEQTYNNGLADDGKWDVTDDRFSDLRVFPQSSAERADIAPIPGEESLARLFERATGFALSDGRGNLDESPDVPVREAAMELAELFRAVSEERREALRALRQREAELATAIPVVLQRDGDARLARRLEAVLRDAARMLGCFAGAVYMLDDATSHLKLRVAWGLPADRLLQAARPLRGAISDLEALLGHIVLLEDTSKLPQWRFPEPAAAAACVPLASCDTPLGTLWFFAERKRAFSEDDGRLLEIVAGRIVAELEREAVARERALSRQVETQLGRARQWQDNRLPGTGRLLDGWDLAAWSAQAERVGGDFHGWHLLPDDRLLVCLGHARGGMLEAALTAASLQGGLSSCVARGGGVATAATLLETLNDSLWTVSPGDQRASFACALVDPDQGRVRFSAAGAGAACVVGAERAMPLVAQPQLLGEHSEVHYAEQYPALAAGDALLLLSEGVTRVEDPRGERLAPSAFAELLREHRGLTAAQLVDHARLLLQADQRAWTREDCTIVVMRRSG